MDYPEASMSSTCGWVGGWVGGWVKKQKVYALAEMRWWDNGLNRWVGGWVGGWETYVDGDPLLGGDSLLVEKGAVCAA